MIPRFAPALGLRELVAAVRPGSRADVEAFEHAFAARMGQRHAIAFPYGRTALMALLEAWGLADSEVIVPAYTCIVVPHAVVLSGNEPVFVDSSDADCNMDLARVTEAMSPKTRAVIATSIFGHPVDLDALAEIRKARPDVRIIQDCAHSFAAEWRGRPVQQAGDAALFGLNISKILTSIFGGMVTTDDGDLAERLRRIRQSRVAPSTLSKSMRRGLYLAVVAPAFLESVYGIVNRLERSGALDRFVRYYEEGRIDMPADYLEGMTLVEARIGHAQVGHYLEIVERRRAAARTYDTRLAAVPALRLPPSNPGSTYSHYAVRVEDREDLDRRCRRLGLQLGHVIDYCCPGLSAYRNRPGARGSYPVASALAREVINLPVHGGAGLAERASALLMRALGV